MRRRQRCTGGARLCGGCLGLTLILVLLIPVSAFGTEDLLFHYRLALRGDPKLRSAEANRNAVGEKLSEAEAGFFPTVAANATRNKNVEQVATENFISSQPAGNAKYYSNEYRLNVSQPVYHADLFAGYRVASADLRRAQSEYAAARQDLTVRVAQAYFDVLLAQDTLAFTGAAKEAVAHQLESAKARLQAGLAPITDVNDAEAGYQNARSQEIDAQNQVADKRQALAEISGQPPEALASLGPNIPLVLPEPPDIDQWTQTAEQQNPAIQAAEAAMESARQTIAQNRTGHYPTLDLVGSRTRDDADASITGPGVRTDNTVVGLQLNVPLYQGGLISARTREAADRYEAAQQDLEARRRNVERTTRSAFQGASGGIAKIQALQQAVESAAASLAAKTEGYSAGLYTTLDVLIATRDLYRAKRDLAEARYGYLLSLLQLKQSAGTLNDDDLIAVNHWLQP